MEEGTSKDKGKGSKRFNKLLVLDLDGTLIHGTFQALSRECDFRTKGGFLVYSRPHLAVFLETVFQWFDVAVWTASGT